VVERFDRSKPNIARVWDYWLGGKAYFATDRDLAETMLEVHPPSAQMARESRQFLGRAVTYVAARGVRQFIDVGAGLPTAVNTHDIARRYAPAGARSRRCRAGRSDRRGRARVRGPVRRAALHRR
jgi:hypothetical protein